MKRKPDFQNHLFRQSRKESLFATSCLFDSLPRDISSALASLHSLCRPRCGGKEVPCKTIVYNSPGQEAYDTLEISRVDLPMNFCYT